MQRESLFYSWKKFSRLQSAILVFFFFIYLYLRLQHRWFREVWVDEQWTMSGFHLPFKEWLFQFLPTHDFHFPGAYIPLYVIGHWFSMDKFALTSPYIFLSCVFFYLFAKMNWTRILNLSKSDGAVDLKWINILACVLITYNSDLIMYSAELRPYAITSLHALIALILVDRVLDLKRFHPGYAFAVMGVAIFHNYGVMYLLLAVTYFLILRMAELDKKYPVFSFLLGFWDGFLTMAVGFVVAMPILWLYAHNQIYHVLDSGFNVHQWIHPGIRGIVQVVAIYYGFKPFRIALLALVAIGIFYFIFKKKWVALVFPCFWVIGPTLLIYCFDLHTRYWFVQRQFVWVVPFHAVFVASAVYVSIKWIQQWYQSSRFWIERRGY